MAETKIPVANNGGKFAIISYSHDDKEAVYDELLLLQEYNINFWYDSENRAGDNWIKNFKKNFDYRNCIGVILFISKNYLKSPSVQLELEHIKSKINDSNKIVLPVLIDELNRDSTVVSLGDIAKDAVTDIFQCDINEQRKKYNIIMSNHDCIQAITGNNQIILGRLCKNKLCPNKNNNNATCKNSSTQGCKFRQDFIDALKQAGATEKIEENNNYKTQTNIYVPDSYKNYKDKTKNFHWILLEENEEGSQLFIASRPLEYAFAKDIPNRFDLIKKSLNNSKLPYGWEIIEGSIRMFTKEEYLNYRTLIKEKFDNFDQSIYKQKDEDDLEKYWWLKDGNEYAFTLSDRHIASYALYKEEEFGIIPLAILRKVGKN